MVCYTQWRMAYLKRNKRKIMLCTYQCITRSPLSSSIEQFIVTAFFFIIIFFSFATLKTAQIIVPMPCGI